MLKPGAGRVMEAFSVNLWLLHGTPGSRHLSMISIKTRVLGKLATRFRQSFFSWILGAGSLVNARLAALLQTVVSGFSPTSADVFCGIVDSPRKKLAA